MPGMHVVHMHTCRQNTHIQSEKPEENNRISTINNAIIIYHLIFYSYRSILIIKVMVSKKKAND